LKPLRHVCILQCSQEDLDHAWRLTCQDDVSTASGAALSLLMTLEHQDIEAIAINAETARDVSGMRITLDLLTSAERRDLANLLVGRPPPGLQLVRRALRGHRSRRPLARRVRTMPGGWNAMNDRRDGPRWP
jgi:hypothetical protein